MSLSEQFKVGQTVTIRIDSDPFPNGGSHIRLGIDIQGHFSFPMRADIRGLSGEIIADYGADPRVVFKTEIGDRQAQFLIPRSICQ